MNASPANNATIGVGPGDWLTVIVQLWLRAVRRAPQVWALARARVNASVRPAIGVCRLEQRAGVPSAVEHQDRSPV